MGSRQTGGARGVAGITSAQLSWVAGFLEGEGSFVANARNGSITMAAAQKQLEPVARLQHLVGGAVHQYFHAARKIDYHKWTLNGSHAIALAFTLYTLMSPRRREQIRTMIRIWQQRPGRNNALKKSCPRGHEYTPENTYLMGGNHRGCRECYRTYYNQPRLAKEA